MTAPLRNLRATVVLIVAIQAVACASKTARPVSPAANPPAVPSITSLGTVVVATALSFQGTPYKTAGSGPLGFDCSGFVQYVFAQHGVVLPREVIEQYQAGRQIRREELNAGDLVFFQTERSGPSHVGIVIGNGQFVHAPSSTGVVRIERYDTRYWGPRYIGARRIS